MSVNENIFEICSNECEQCGDTDLKTFGCIKCGTVVCTNCIDEYISDWECVCKECGW